MRIPPIPIPTDLPAPVALALIDLLEALRQSLWEHYESELIPIVMAEINQDSTSQSEGSDLDDILRF